jgi:hypothetical protein
MQRVATFYHVTPAANRGSIRQHGLDWRRGGGGIAGSLAPEQDGVFLSRDRFEAQFFIDMGKRRFDALDVWEVTIDADSTLDLEQSNDRIREFDGLRVLDASHPPGPATPGRARPLAAHLDFDQPGSDAYCFAPTSRIPTP